MRHSPASRVTFQRSARTPPTDLRRASADYGRLSWLRCTPRLPGYRLWLWDGQFCGSIGLRWQPSTSALPAHVLGHIGYAVVPWKRRLGYATRALALLLPKARDEGLRYVDITTDVENISSQKVILANAGVLIERFQEPLHYGGHPALRFRIYL